MIFRLVVDYRVIGGLIYPAGEFHFMDVTAAQLAFRLVSCVVALKEDRPAPSKEARAVNTIEWPNKAFNCAVHYNGW